MDETCLFIVIQLQIHYNAQINILEGWNTMGYGRKSQAKKMDQRTGQAKKKAKIKAKIAAGKAARKK